MQQHHQHVTRAATVVPGPPPPQALRGHPIPALHGNANMVPPALNLPQVSQQTGHPIPAAAVPSKNASPIPTTANPTNSHSSRLQHSHHNNHSVNGRSSSQMSKTRQQHQHQHQQHQQQQLTNHTNNLSSNNLSNNNNNHYNQGGVGGGGVGANLPLAQAPYPAHPKSQQAQQQQQLSYNHINAPNPINHMGVASQQQQQRNVIYHNPNAAPHQQMHSHLSHHGPPPPPPNQPPPQHMKNPMSHPPHQHLHNGPPLPLPASQQASNKHLAKHSHSHHPHQTQASPPLPPNTNGSNNAPPPPPSATSFYQANNRNRIKHHQHQHPSQSYPNNNFGKPSAKGNSQHSSRHPKASNGPAANHSKQNKNSLAENSMDSSSTQSSTNSESHPETTKPSSPSLNSQNINNTTNTNINNISNNINEDDKNQHLNNSNDNSSEDYENSTENQNNNKNSNNNDLNIINNNNNNDTTHNNMKSSLTNNSNNILSNEDLSVSKNSKEKTPMCLVNELARFNKITHQYRLTNEKGPAHCKRFTVTLKLGEEEYTAEGYKIKKAQHLAAAEAIEKTKYKHPISKAHRRNEEGHASRMNITPTVELNALAMKLGQQTYYLYDPRQTPPAEPLHQPNDGLGPFVGQHPPLMPPPPPPHQMMDPIFMRRNGGNAFVPGHHAQIGQHHRYGPSCLQRNGFNPKYPQRFPVTMPHLGSPAPGVPMHPAFTHPPVNCKITLIVGKQRFVGIGRNLQQAKHDAAARALQVLKNQLNDEANSELNSSLDDSDSKSPISMVHEIGLKRNMPVHFKVLREEGPAHMKNFITACIVGNIVTEGEGNGKKTSKKKAAEKMLEELKKLPPMTPTKSPIKRIKVKTPAKMTPGGKVNARKRANTASIKERFIEENDDENPVSKLIQIQQNRKEKEPVFELISKNGNEKSRRREFIMEVTAQGMVARGTGTTKKLAKRNAALNLLIAMGFEKDKSDLTEAGEDLNESKTDSNTSMNINNVSSSSAHPSTSGVSEMSEGSSSLNPPLSEIEVPVVSTPAGEVKGILLVRPNKKNSFKKKDREAYAQKTTEEKRKSLDDSQNVPTHNSSKDLNSSHSLDDSFDGNTSEPSKNENRNGTDGSSLDSGATNSGQDSVDSTSLNSSTKSNGVHMKEQLLYLAKLLDFEVSFSDYPKGNHSEFLTIVTLSTEPPQICHGVGANADESQNDAARNALKILSELGLNSAK